MYSAIEHSVNMALYKCCILLLLLLVFGLQATTGEAEDFDRGWKEGRSDKEEQDLDGDREPVVKTRLSSRLLRGRGDYEPHLWVIILLVFSNYLLY